MVVGSNENARHLGEALEQSADYGIRLMGFLEVGRGGARFHRFRDLDEDGHAVYRQLVVGFGLADHSPNHSARFDRQGSKLIRRA